MSRRTFVGSVLGAGFSLGPWARGLRGGEGQAAPRRATSSCVIATWPFGLRASAAAMEALAGGGSPLDAAVRGATVIEDDPTVQSVGLGGLPDEDGVVTLDACVMGPEGRAGAVAALEKVRSAAAVARRVMERTDHILLVGEGARRFALAEGFKEEDLLTEESRQRWLQWKADPARRTHWIAPGDHDTVSVLAQDGRGDLAGVCTTSGLAWKIHGRVGDSPLIGAGLYVDNEVGAAASTGVGEECIRIGGSFLVVERMREGASPQEACEEPLRRILRRRGAVDFQLCFIALSRSGEVGAASLQRGFQYALFAEGVNELHEGKPLLEE